MSIIKDWSETTSPASCSSDESGTQKFDIKKSRTNCTICFLKFPFFWADFQVVLDNQILRNVPDPSLIMKYTSYLANVATAKVC